MHERTQYLLLTTGAMDVMENFAFDSRRCNLMHVTDKIFQCLLKINVLTHFESLLNTDSTSGQLNPYFHIIDLLRKMCINREKSLQFLYINSRIIERTERAVV